MAASIDTSAFARALQGVIQLLSPDQIDKIRLFTRDEELETRVSYLAQRANEGELTPDEKLEYERYVEANSSLASLLAAAKYLGAVLTMTREVFHMAATAEIENDAELNESYFLISVTASGPVDAIVALHHEWHQNLPSIAGNETSYFRLAMRCDGVSMDLPSCVLSAFPPSPDALLELSRVQIDNDMLLEIARADYGVGAGEIYGELLPIRNRGAVPSPLPFWVREVCSLTRYSTPDPPFYSGPPDFRAHWIRLFCCTLLLRSHDTENISVEDDISLTQGLASAKILGDEVSFAAARFLTWGFSKLTYNYNSTHLPWHLAMLVVAVRLRAGRFTNSQLTEIAQWVLDAEAKYLQDCPVHVADPPPTNFSVQSGYWTPLVAELKTAADSISDECLRTNLELCAMIMKG